MLALVEITEGLDGPLARDVDVETQVTHLGCLPRRRERVRLVLRVGDRSPEGDELVCVEHSVCGGRRDFRLWRIRRLHVHRHTSTAGAALGIPHLEQDLPARCREGVVARDQALTIRRSVWTHVHAIHQPRHRQLVDGVVGVSHRATKRLGIALADRVAVGVARDLCRGVGIELRHASVRAGGQRNAENGEHERHAHGHRGLPEAGAEATT